MRMTPLREMLEGFRKENDTQILTEELAKNKVKSFNKSRGNLNEQDGYNCDICRNKGYMLRLTNDGYEVAFDCECQKIRKSLRRAQRSGLGNIITEYTFKNYIDDEEWQKEIKNKAIEFCDDDTAKWFFIGGQVGCGKTMICTAIAAHYINIGYEVKYMLWAEESKKLKALVNDEGYQDEIEEYKNVDVLYIDDFLKVKYGETPTAADINLAFELINHRLLDGGKITVISSEKLLDEIMQYDEATMSRIYQKTGKYKLNIQKDKNKNYRLRGKGNG